MFEGRDSDKEGGKKEASIKITVVTKVGVRENSFWWCDSKPEHVDDFHKQEDIH